MQPTRLIILLLPAVFTLMLLGCATPKGDTPDEKRASVQMMRNTALAVFSDKVPSMRGQLERAAGFGVFRAVSAQTGITATSNAYGIIRDNATGKDTYMRALKLGGGLGVGVQDLDAVIVFTDAKVLQDVLRDGWAVTGRVEAAAKVEDTGDAGAVVFTLPGMQIYRFTRNGVMIGGSIDGAKVWPDKQLN